MLDSFLKVLEHKTSAKSIYAQVAEARQGLQPMQSRRGNTVGDPGHPSSHSRLFFFNKFVVSIPVSTFCSKITAHGDILVNS